jgi:hypothetical protein
MLSNVYDAFSSYNESTMKTNLVQGSTRISIHMDKKKNLCVQKKVTDDSVLRLPVVALVISLLVLTLSLTL